VSAVYAHIPDYTFPDGKDRIYIHGMDIPDPYNRGDVTWDTNTDVPVLVIEVEPSEDEQPYRVALRDKGFNVVGTDDYGDWILEEL
jgi:hypothetical protein